MVDRYDLIVVGGGAAGLTAVWTARRLGLRMALIERGRVGGDCTWTGCVPSKALLRAAGIAEEIRSAGGFGIDAEAPTVDFPRVMQRVRRVIETIYEAEAPERLRSEGIEVIEGTARFQGPRAVDAAGRELTARKFLVCTGARPLIPPIPGLADVPFLTYETVWGLENLPERLAVVGGGAVGCELAQAFQRLGSSVTLVEARDRLLPDDDPEASKLIARRLSAEGVDVRLSAGLESIRKEGEASRLTLSGGSEVDADSMLLAVGRRPDLEGLGLDAAGVEHDRNGIRVDKNGRTNRRHIYAAGDCTGGYQFTHHAAYQGFMAVRNAFLPLNTRAVPEHVPWVTFTDPEVAHVGLTDEQARRRFGADAMATMWPMAQVDRARIDGEDEEGFLRVVYRRNGKILGATMVSPRAGEAIHEWVLALDRGLKLQDVGRLMHVYPTYSLASQQLAAEYGLDRVLSGWRGKLARWLARGIRRQNR